MNAKLSQKPYGPKQREKIRQEKKARKRPLPLKAAMGSLTAVKKNQDK